MTDLESETTVDSVAKAVARDKSWPRSSIEKLG